MIVRKSQQNESLYWMLKWRIQDAKAQQLFMLIEQTVDELYVHRKECRLTVAYVEEVRKGNVYGAKLRLSLDSKANNLSPRKLAAEVELEEQQLKSLRRKLLSPLLYIHRRYPRLTVLGYLSIALTDTTSSSTKKEIQTADVAVNYGQKYWTVQGPLKAEGSTTQPFAVSLLQRNPEGGVTIGKFQIHQLKLSQNKILQLENLQQKSFLQNKENNEDKKKGIQETKIKICRELQRMFKLKTFTVDEKLSNLKVNSKLFQLIPVNSQTIHNQSQALTLKVQLFRHIFLTELISHMIINQFGRNKRKKDKYKDGRINYQYEDEHLQALRSCGMRLSEFRDYSIESFDSPQDECESSESEEPTGNGGSRQKKKKVKTRVSKVGKKIKRILNINISTQKEVQNFIVMSGKDKSLINKKRYCLHQMTRETDKTQAFINFVQLVFSAYWPKYELLSKEGESEYIKKKRLAYFMKNFKVKRSPFSCLREYTRESFFHKVLNVGLRILKESHELVYLRFPFSHIFWSIKALYQRHKRAIFQLKRQKNEKKVINLYRGFKMTAKQVKNMKQNVGAFIEMEGFLSTTQIEEIMNFFIVNVRMIFQVPVSNLRGMHDNGFASTSHCSAHPNEREVLFNAFNLFKIKSICTKTQNKLNIYEITLEYGGIKEVEDKVRKSQNLLESEFLMKMEEEKIESVRHLLSMKREKMNPEMVEKLDEDLSKEEKKLEKWKKTLSTQEKQEFKAAYEELSKWEKELLDNFTHQEHTMRHIDNYGELLAGVGDYERGMGYCERMLKQVERDRAIEGWQWRKTPCLPHKQQVYRILLAQCYNTQCRYGQQVQQLERITEVYVSMNMNNPPCPYFYIALLKQLQNARYHLRLSERMYLNRYSSKKVNSQQESSYSTLSTQDVYKKVWETSATQLQGMAEEKRQKLKLLSKHTGGKYTANYLSEHYTLIYILYHQQVRKSPREVQHKREYKQVKKEILAYFANTHHMQHPNITISLFKILLQIVDNDGKVDRIWLGIFCRHFAAFLPAHIYDSLCIHLLSQSIRLCILKDELMSLRRILVKLKKVQIHCPLSPQDYDKMVIIFACMWSTSQECLAWVTNTQQQVHSLSQQYREQHDLLPTTFAPFPHSIAHWKDKQHFHYILHGNKMISFEDVIKGCLHMKQLYTHHWETSRQQQHLSSTIYHHLHLYHLPKNNTTQRQVFPQHSTQVLLWHHPCEPSSRRWEEDGVGKLMGLGHLMMVMQYLHPFHPHYIRVVSSTSRLHLPHSSYFYLEKLIQQLPFGIQQGIKNIRRKYQYLVNQLKDKESHIFLQRKVSDLKKPNQGKKQTVTIIRQCMYQQQSEWRDVEFEGKENQKLLFLEGSLRKGNRWNMYKTKNSCWLLLGAETGVQRVMGLWDGQQLGYANKQLETMEKMHDKSLPLPHQSMLREGGSSLAILMEDEVQKQIKEEHFLQQQQYLLPAFKTLLELNSIPIQFMEALFCEPHKILQQLFRQPWKAQIQNALQHHYPTPLAQKLSGLPIQKQILLTQKYLRYSDAQCDEEKSNCECVRYGVLRVLVEKQSLHPSLLQLLLPIMCYESMERSDYDYEWRYWREYNIRNDGYEAFVQACVESRSCLHDGWSIPKWWRMPRF